MTGPMRLMVGLAVPCAANVIVAGLLIVNPAIGDQSSLAGLFAFICLAGFATGIIGSAAFIGAPKSNASFAILAVYLIAMCSDVLLLSTGGGMG